MPANQLAVAAGELRQKITIQAATTARDAFGQESTSWSTVLITRGSVEVAAARELYAAGGSKFTSQVTHTITVRYPGSGVSIAAGMRATIPGHTYLIQAPENVEQRNRKLKLMCLEIEGSE